jgi:tetratricopeptide (TPR) repeat protein
MARPRRPNSRLRRLLTEAAWTGQQLADAANAAGSEAGLTLRYDRTSVAHWLAGTPPRPPVPDLLCEVLTRRLGHPVYPGDIGLAKEPGTGHARGVALSSGAALTLPGEFQRLAAQQFGQARPAGPAYNLAAAGGLAWTRPDRVAPIGRTAHLGTSGPEVTATGVAAIEAMRPMFTMIDDAHGGGSARVALSGYLAQDVAPRLSQRARPAVRRRLFTVAAELTYFCGFMCFDDGLHGLAQRYYHRALELAVEAANEEVYAITLRAMSVQAHALGHVRHSLQLAETAAAIGGHTDPLLRAFLFGQAAVAHAGSGDRLNALTSFAAAERQLDRVTSGSRRIAGSYDLASLAHQQAILRASLNDVPGAISSLAVSIRRRPAEQRRSRAITLARLAELQLRQGHLEESVVTWTRFLDDAPYLRSQRVSTALRTLRATLRPFGRYPAAAAISARAQTLEHSG